MGALTSHAIEGEIIPPDAMVWVYGTTHPLNAVAGSRIACQLPAGLSIAEILEAALAGKAHVRKSDLIVSLGDHRIPVDNWSRIRVKAGAVLTFMPRLGNGGGSSTTKSVLGLAVAVAALFVAPELAPFLISGAAAIGLTLSTNIAIALISGGIILAGTLALNALYPTRPAAAAQASTPLNSIQGAQNQLPTIDQPIPVVLGRSLNVPFYAAKPYTEIVGDDQYLRVAFCLGYGPLQVDTLQIGQTPIGNFADVQIEIRQGYPGDPPLTLIVGSVDEQDLQVTLDNTVDAPRVNGNGGAWNTQTTSANTNEISVDFTAPDGINATDPQGNDISWPVTAEMQYAPAGSGAWVAGGQVTFTRNYSPSRLGINIAVAQGQYDVRCRKLTGQGVPEFTRDTIVWTALRSIKSAAPITSSKPLALVALRIKASGQLSGVINTFNCMTAPIVAQLLSGANNQPARNPADLFLLVLRGPANERPVDDSQINFASLAAWWTYCDANGFKFNQVVNATGSVYDKLADIAAAGRAVPTFVNGQWAVDWDRPDDPIVQHFTPRNSWGFQLQHPYAQQPHAFIATFTDETNGFVQDKVTIYDDGYDASNATLFEGIQFPGITDPSLTWRMGRFHIAQSRLRPEKVTLSVGWEHLVCTRGDRVRVTHDAMLIGLASGRIKAIAGQVVTIDEAVTLEEGQTYGLQIRIPGDARSLMFAVDPATGTGEDLTALTLVGDLTTIAPGQLFAFGNTDQESAVYRIQGIAHQQDLVATLTLVDDAPAISQADQGAIPPYNPNVTLPPDPLTLSPRSLQVLEIVDGQGANVRDFVRLTWQLPRLGNVASFEVQARDDDAAGPWRPAGTVVVPAMTQDVPITSAGVWSFQVRCTFENGTVSSWAQKIGVNLHGLTFAPDDVTNLHEEIVDGQTMLNWTPVADQRILFYEIRKGTAWDTALVVGDAIAQPPWQTTGDGTYHVRAYVLSPFGTKIYSADDASILIAGSIISRNIIIQRDEQATGWTGGLDGGVIDGGFIRTDVAHAIALPWSTEIVDDLALTGLHIAAYVSAQIVDIGQSNQCRFWTLFEADGVTIGADFLHNQDPATGTLGSVDILGVAPTRYIRAFPIWRFADGSDRDVFAPADVFSPADVFTSGVDWGEWTAVASGTRVARYFQPGYVLITADANTNATGTKLSWFVDVPDREDDYTDLTVPIGGLALTFYQGGFNAAPVPGQNPLKFNGGPNGSAVPHLQCSIINPTAGDQVVITGLTAAGCTVHVVNAGANVARAGVNILAIGF